MAGKWPARSRMLRSNSLIWHYWVQLPVRRNPPAFDVLYWNMDTTRMPAGCMRSTCAVSISTTGWFARCADPLPAGDRRRVFACRCTRLAAREDHIARGGDFRISQRVQGRCATPCPAQPHSRHRQSAGQSPKRAFWSGEARAEPIRTAGSSASASRRDRGGRLARLAAGQRRRKCLRRPPAAVTCKLAGTFGPVCAGTLTGRDQPGSSGANILAGVAGRALAAGVACRR